MNKKIAKILTLTATIALFFLYIYPFILVVINSFKDRASVIRDPMSLPDSLDFSNFFAAYTTMDFTTAVINSIMVTTISIVLIIFFASMLAYFLQRWDWKINKTIFTVLVLSMIIPFQVVMLPFVVIYGSVFGVLDSLPTLIFAYLGFGVAQSTFLYHGFIKSIPRELEEAAAIDGAGRIRTFFQVVFPILKPITSTIAILNVLWIWNDFLLPSIVITSASNRTIPLSTFAFFGRFTADFGVAMAGLLLAIIPIIAFYLVLQKHIIKGISDGAIK
ncbi:MAG: carbohydrate ABC transporter permease [Defluviitaleaceae bacterium]|nr:carbohydrate ABC transporter permease [Defluviitaleaceae bacterium]